MFSPGSIIDICLLIIDLFPPILLSVRTWGVQLASNMSLLVDCIILLFSACLFSHTVLLSR